MITNAELKLLASAEDSYSSDELRALVRRLSQEVIQQRAQLLAERRHCAELAGLYSLEASGCIRQYAQYEEYRYSLGDVPDDDDGRDPMVHIPVQANGLDRRALGKHESLSPDDVSSRRLIKSAGSLDGLPRTLREAAERPPRGSGSTKGNHGDPSVTKGTPRNRS